MTEGTDTAKGIVRHLLDQMALAYLTNDFSLYRPNFHLPLKIEMSEGELRVNSVADLQTFFDGYRAHMDKHCVTDLVRNCVEAEFKEPGVITSTHETRLLSKTTLIQKPYPVYSIIRLIDGEWRVTDGIHDLTYSSVFSRPFYESAAGE